MIPIARPQVDDPEIENVACVLRSGMLSGGGFDKIRHLILSVLAHTIIVRTAEERNQTQINVVCDLRSQQRRRHQHRFKISI